MLLKRSVLVATAAVIAAGTVVLADSHGGNPAVEARQSHMQLYGHNLGVLGGMARGNIDFNAEAAQAAADNLAALATLNQMSYWPPGTSTDELGEETRALPVIWDSESMEDIIANATALVEATSAMQAAAGTLEGVQATIGAIGETCSACHRAFRQPNN